MQLIKILTVKVLNIMQNKHNYTATIFNLYFVLSNGQDSLNCEAIPIVTTSSLFPAIVNAEKYAWYLTL